VLPQLPSKRFNANLAILQDTIFIYGGTVEKGDRELMLDSLYAIDLNRCDGVKVVFEKQEEGEWMDTDEEDGDGDEWEDDEEEDISDSSEEEGEMSGLENTSEALRIEQQEMADEGTEPTTKPENKFPIPRPFESLKAFYDRASLDFEKILIASEKLRAVHGKEMRKIVFTKVEEQWWDCREEVREIEDRLGEEGAGVQEVLDKSQQLATSFKRRV
jgi:hypothetical protein